MTVSKILFIHHSTGGNLLHEGNVRKLLYEKNKNIELWDHGYNLYTIPLLSNFLGTVTFHTGLSDNNGIMTKEDFNITISNNSPKEYADIFSRKPTDPTLKAILNFDLIIFKNCFPTSHIHSNEKLQEHMLYFSQIRDALQRYPHKKFILFTPPPLRKELTNTDEATRARMLSQWLSTPNYSQNVDNLHVFNFFDLLADSKGNNTHMLKREYTRWIPIDSHPNKRANITIAPLFVDFILNTVL